MPDTAPPDQMVYCISDHTGVTAETLAHSLVSQFEGITPRFVTRPFVDTEAKMGHLVDELTEITRRTGRRPIVFSTLADRSLSGVLKAADALVLGIFDRFVDDLSEELQLDASAGIGRYHSMRDFAAYQQRLDAVDYSLMTDDGVGLQHYPRADVILVGVSRVGKTPTSLYLAMQYGIRAANYPLTDEDLEVNTLPEALVPYRDRLQGLSIDPTRLHQIRKKRRASTHYSSLERCMFEVRQTEALFLRERIAHLDATARSIEEIAAQLIEDTGMIRRVG